MSLEECYLEIGGNYNEVLSRLMDEKRVAKFLLRFLDDQSFELLKNSLEAENFEEAFRAAHTLKGICQNLGFTMLYNSVFKITEALRGGKRLNDQSLLDSVEMDYAVTVAAISRFKQESRSPSL